MDPYYLNYPTGSPASGDEFVLSAQSVDQDFRTSSIQSSAPEYLLTATQPLYTSLGPDSYGTTPLPRMSGTNSARSLRPSMGSGSVRTSSLSSHPYRQARLCHATDRASAQHQEWTRTPPLSTFPPTASDTVIPIDTVNNSRASPHCHNSSPSPLVTNHFALVPTIGSVLQSTAVPPNANEDMPSPTDNFPVPGQVSLPNYSTPPSSPDALADPADIEYAQYRYSGKRCFYRCRFDLLGSPCNKWIVGDRTRVLRHLRNYHHLQIGPAAPAVCRWDECTHSRPMKQENLSRHVVTHLGVKWKCSHCRRLFSRDDAVHRHIERMVPGMDVTDAEVVPGRGARALTEPQSKKARIA